jgi:hypothetical protein
VNLCACGNDKYSAKLLTCPTCWAALPMELKHEHENARHLPVEQRRSVVRKILEIARANAKPVSQPSTPHTQLSLI